LTATFPGLAWLPSQRSIHRYLKLLPNIRLALGGRHRTEFHASHPTGLGLNLSVPEKFDVAEIYWRHCLEKVDRGLIMPIRPI